MSKDQDNRAAASYVLSIANKAVTKERGPQHGDAEMQFNMAAEFWSTYLSYRNGDKVEVTAADVGLMMDLLKTTRIVVGDPTIPDHYADKAGYTGLSGALNGVQAPPVATPVVEPARAVKPSGEPTADNLSAILTQLDKEITPNG